MPIKKNGKKKNTDKKGLFINNPEDFSKKERNLLEEAVAKKLKNL